MIKANLCQSLEDVEAAVRDVEAAVRDVEAAVRDVEAAVRDVDAAVRNVEAAVRDFNCCNSFDCECLCFNHVLYSHSYVLSCLTVLFNEILTHGILPI